MRKGLIEPSLLVSTHGNIEINNGRARCGTGSLPGLLVSSATVFLQRISKGKLPRHPSAFNRYCRLVAQQRTQTQTAARLGRRPEAAARPPTGNSGASVAGDDSRLSPGPLERICQLRVALGCGPRGCRLLSFLL